MSVPDPAAVDWVPLYNLQSAIPPVVNGQWIKGVGGAAVWSSITPADVQGGVGMQKIQDVVLGATGILDFTAIPQTYTHLRLDLEIRDTFAAALASPSLRFNGDASAGYYYITGADTDTTHSFAAAVVATTQALCGVAPGSTAAPNVFGATTINFPNYTVAAHTKSYTFQSYAFGGSGTSGQMSRYGGGVWGNVTNVTRIQILGNGGGSTLAAGSRGTLYGLA